MTYNNQLNIQFNKMALWAVAITLVSAVASAFFPLDVPGGETATDAERLAWLTENTNAFISAWVVQIAAMLGLSLAMAGAAWQVRALNPLAALVAGVVVTMSIMAFIIPKFIAVWTIPLATQAYASGGDASELAAQIVALLNVSIPYSLFTSFDYLGFWGYAVFGLLVMKPLFQLSKAGKVAAVGYGAYGVLYHLLVVGVLTGNVVGAAIWEYGGMVSALLLVGIIATAVEARKHLGGNNG